MQFAGSAGESDFLRRRTEDHYRRRDEQIVAGFVYTLLYAYCRSVFFSVSIFLNS